MPSPKPARPKLTALATILILAATLGANHALAGRDGAITDPNHAPDGTMLDKATRDNIKSINHDAAKFGEPSGAEDGGWIDGHTHNASPNANLGK